MDEKRKFQVGDIIVAEKNYFSQNFYTDSDMISGLVMRVCEDGYIDIKILNHKHSYAIGEIEHRVPTLFKLLEGEVRKKEPDIDMDFNLDKEELFQAFMRAADRVQLGLHNQHSSMFQDMGFVIDSVGVPDESDEDDSEQMPPVEDMRALQELNALDGLEGVKRTVNEIIAHAKVSAIRSEFGLKNEKHSLHMVFKGNPGTGKTTVARIIGRVMREAGLLQGKHGLMPFVELTSADIESKYVGEAEENIIEKFEQARGGVLFLDEAYSFVGYGENMSSNKNVAVIVKKMEDMRDEVLVIAAGYDEDMEEFLDFNTGLRSRFTNTIRFDDYTIDELITIGGKMAVEKDYVLSDEFNSRLQEVLELEKQLKHFGNARTVRNIIERAIRTQCNRIANMSDLTKDQVMELKAEDIIFDEAYTRELIKREKDKEEKEKAKKWAHQGSK